ncbi:MAG: helix-turn-helix domain-containing protein [Allorhizobium sp.]
MEDDLKSELSVGGLFGVADAPFLVTRPVRDADLSVTHLVCCLEPGATRVVCIPKQDCYFLMLYLDDSYHCDLTPDGEESAVRHYRKGSICLVDLAEGASIRLHDTLHSLAFMIPRRLLNEVSEFSKAPKARNLRCRRGENDEVMRNLGTVLLPLFEPEQPKPSPVLGHVAVAICAHLLHQHGDMSADSKPGPDLSVWQEKAAKDFMAAHFTDNIEVSMVAKAAGLAEARFSVGFEKVTGQTPDEWLAAYRVAQAKRHLMEHQCSLEEVAALSGFRDLVHFDHEFCSLTGASPGRWRNRWLN